MSGQQPRRLRYLKWLTRYLKDNGYKGTDVWDCVQEQLAPYRSARYIMSRLVWHAKPIVRPLAKLALPTSLYSRMRSGWEAQVSRDSP